MLTSPPCVRLLVGCLSSDIGSPSSESTGTSSSHSSLSIDGSSSRSSSSRSSVEPIARSSLADLSARLPSFASGTLITRSTKEYTAHYLISARNIGTSALQGITITHGPLPFGAEFLPKESDALCSQSGKEVACRIDLPSGSAKELALVYKASGSMSCSLARLLQKAKATMNAVTGSTNANAVVTTVTCRMQSTDIGLLQGSSDGSALGSSSSLASVNTTVVVQGSGLIVGMSGSKDIGHKQVYKEYTTIIPRTGAMQDLFASVDGQNSMIIQRHVGESSFFALPIFIISLVSIFIVCLMLQRSFGRSVYARSRK